MDFTKSRNVLIAALIMGLSIGVSYSTAGAIAIPIGSVTIKLSGLAVGSLAGIILNAVLPVDDDKPTNPLEGPTKAVREQMDELGTPVSADDPATELVNAERKAKEQLGS